MVSWSPGFHGGMDQYFRLRYGLAGGGAAKFVDVYPANVGMKEIRGLRPGRRYAVAAMAFNNVGESEYTREAVVFSTAEGWCYFQDLFSKRVRN